MDRVDSSAHRFEAPPIGHSAAPVELSPPIERDRFRAPASHRVWLSEMRTGLPAYNQDRTVHAAARGWIANRDELRRRLDPAGHRLASGNDDQLIAHAYEAWGEETADRVKGGCSFVVIDDRRRSILAVRDRMGMSSLYYAQAADGLAFASRPSRLAYLLNRPLELEPSALAYVLALGYVPAPLSIWRGIRRLEPGHLLRWSTEAGVRIRRYWDPVAAPEAITEDAPDPEVWWAAFERTVPDHVREDPAFGLMFSGGLDSTAIAVALRRAGQPVDAVTARSSLCGVDETETAAAIAGHLGITARRVRTGEGEIGSLLGCAAECEEPRAHRALVSTFVLSEAARDGHGVLLSGHGTEAVFDWPPFGGVHSAAPRRRRSRISRRTVGSLRRRVGSTPGLRRLLGGPAPPSSVTPAARAMRANVERFRSRSDAHARVRRLCPFFLPHEIERILAPLGVSFTEEHMLEPWTGAGEGERALRRATLLGFYADLSLGAYEEAGRRHGVEIRFPFLASDLVERTVSAGRPSTRKEWFLHYLGDAVPRELLERPKAGFELERLWKFDWEAGMERIRRGPWARSGLWSEEWEQLVAPGTPNRRWRWSNLILLSRWAERWHPGTAPP